MDLVSPDDNYESTNQRNAQELGEKVNERLPLVPPDVINEINYEVRPEPVKQPNGTSTFASIMPPETSRIDFVYHPKEKYENKLEGFFFVNLEQRFENLERRVKDLEQEVGEIRPQLIALSVGQCLVLAQERLVEWYEDQNKLADDFQNRRKRQKANIIYQLVKGDKDLKPKFTQYQVNMMFGIEDGDLSQTLLNRGNAVAHPPLKGFDYISDGLEGIAKESLHVLYDYVYGQK